MEASISDRAWVAGFGVGESNKIGRLAGGVSWPRAHWHVSIVRYLGHCAAGPSGLRMSCSGADSLTV